MRGWVVGEWVRGMIVREKGCCHLRSAYDDSGGCGSKLDLEGVWG